LARASTVSDGNTINAADLNDVVNDYISQTDASAQTVASALTVTGAFTTSAAITANDDQDFAAGKRPKADFLYLNPSTAPAATEGHLYYASADDKLKIRDASNWLTFPSVKVSHTRMATIAAGVADEMAVFRAPKACTVLAVGIVTDDNVTGDAVNYMTLDFQNKGAAGAGADSIASYAFTAGNDATAFDYLDFGAVSNATLAESDTITLVKTIAAAGLTMPNLVAVIEYELTE
jgi:hypothetical protein